MVRLDGLTILELLKAHADIANRLRHLEVCRSSNNVVADYAEWLLPRARA
jgi:hypothetical protein